MYLKGRNSLSEVDIEEARFILVLAVSTSDFRADSMTIDVLDQIGKFNTKGYILAECIQDGNRERFREEGADAVLRPVRAYPELIVRAMAAPGTEEIIENLFQHQGVHPRRYNVDIKGRNWGVLASRLLQHGFGTPLGYLTNDETVVTNPSPDTEVEGKAIFLMVNQESIPDEQDIAQCIDSEHSNTN